MWIGRHRDALPKFSRIVYQCLQFITDDDKDEKRPRTKAILKSALRQPIKLRTTAPPAQFGAIGKPLQETR